MKDRRYIAYVRKSTEGDERQELSLKAQKRAIMELAEATGIVVMGDILEEAKSAKSPGRPVYARMMADLRAGKANAVLVWHLDRLARNPLDGGELIWALSEGVVKEILTPHGRYTGSGNDKLMMSIMLGMATKYSDDLSVNVHRGMREALEQGRWPNKPKIGYRRDARTKVIVPDEERWDLVRRLWRLRLDQGMPVDDIYSSAARPPRVGLAHFPPERSRLPLALPPGFGQRLGHLGDLLGEAGDLAGEPVNRGPELRVLGAQPLVLLESGLGPLGAAAHTTSGSCLAAHADPMRARPVTTARRGRAPQISRPGRGTLNRYRKRCTV